MFKVEDNQNTQVPENPTKDLTWVNYTFVTGYSKRWHEDAISAI